MLAVHCWTASLKRRVSCKDQKLQQRCVVSWLHCARKTGLPSLQHVSHCAVPMSALFARHYNSCFALQASKAELVAELQRLQAVQLGPYWRLVDPAYLGSALEMLVAR